MRRQLTVLFAALAVIAVVPAATGFAEPPVPPITGPLVNFVESSIASFNQAVVQPLVNAVEGLEGDVDQLDQRVEVLEAPGNSHDEPIPIVTDRLFRTENSPFVISGVVSSGATPEPPEPPPDVGTTYLIDTDDGTTIASYDGALVASSNCDGTRALLLPRPTGGIFGDSSGAPGALLVDTSNGEVLGSYDLLSADIFANKALFGCSLTIISAGLEVVRNRAALGTCNSESPLEPPSTCQVLLIDTDTGTVIRTYEDFQDFSFNCTGDRLSMGHRTSGLNRETKLIDTVTGDTVLTSSDAPSSRPRFVCS